MWNNCGLIILWDADFFWYCGANLLMSSMIFYRECLVWYFIATHTKFNYVTKGKRNFSAWMLYFWWKWPIYFYPISSDADPMRWRRNNFSNQVHTNSSILRGGCSKKGKVWPSTKPPSHPLPFRPLPFRVFPKRKILIPWKIMKFGIRIRINRLWSRLGPKVKKCRHINSEIQFSLF